jgi:hypothetical protein
MCVFSSWMVLEQLEPVVAQHVSANEDAPLCYIAADRQHVSGKEHVSELHLLPDEQHLSVQQNVAH